MMQTRNEKPVSPALRTGKRETSHEKRVTRDEKRVTINPDLQFIRSIKKDSLSDLKTCMQCGACTVVCDLAPEENPFPRKEMMWASWGLKQKLLSDPDLWLCHQCGDCTSYCPRGVHPGDVMASLRISTILNYARPKFLARWMHDWRFLPLILLFPVVLISFILILAGTFQIPEGPVVYSKFFPHAWLNGSFSLFFFGAIFGMIIGIRKYWKDMQKEHPGDIDKTSFWSAFKLTFSELLSHRKFAMCRANRIRQVGHLMIFYGFMLLLFVTAFAIVALLFFEYPLGFWHPVKIAGNLGGLSLLAGCIIQLIHRIRDKELHSAWFDWSFLVSFILLAISGFFVEWARFENWSAAYHIYFIHLIFVWYLILFLPYSKFAHMVYRFVAIFYSKRMGRR